MATNDVRVISTGGHSALPEETWQTEAASTAIKVGELVKQKSTGSPYAVTLADGDGVIGTTARIIGLASSDGTHTSAADGVVRVLRPTGSTVFRVKAKSAAAADTDAEIKAMAGDYYVIDVTTATQTMDTAGGHNLANAFSILGTGDSSRSEIDFSIREQALSGPTS